MNMLPILVPSSAKLIITQILVIAKLNGRKDPVVRSCVMIWSFLVNNYLLRVSNWSTKVRHENCSNEDSRMMSEALFWCFDC